MASRTGNAFRKLPDAGRSVGNGIAAIGDRLWSMVVGSGKTAHGAFGGIIGIFDRIAATTVNIVGGVTKAAGGFASKFPATTIVVGSVGLYAGIKSWMNHRKNKTSLEEIRTANAIMQTQAASADLQTAAMSSPSRSDTMTGFENPDVRTDNLANLQARDAAAKTLAAAGTTR